MLGCWAKPFATTQYFQHVILPFSYWRTNFVKVSLVCQGRLDHMVWGPKHCILWARWVPHSCFLPFGPAWFPHGICHFLRIIIAHAEDVKCFVHVRLVMFICRITPWQAHLSLFMHPFFASTYLLSNAVQHRDMWDTIWSRTSCWLLQHSFRPA